MNKKPIISDTLETIGEFMRKHYIGIICGIIIFAVVVIMIAAIISSIPVLTEGIVIDRIYEEAYTSTQTKYIYVDDVRVPIQEDVRHKEKYLIVIIGTTKKGKQKRETWEVTSLQWDSFAEGDIVFRDPETGIVTRAGVRK